jgi:hypothetical protein
MQGLYGRGIANANQQLSNAQGLYGRGMADWQNYVTGANSLINQNYNNDIQAEAQREASSGLSNSTVGNAVRAGTERQRAMSLGLLAQQGINVDTGLTGQVQGALQNQAMMDQGLTSGVNQSLSNLTNTDTGLTQNLAGVIERRSDPYPSFDQYVNTMMSLGQAAGLGGGGASLGGYSGQPAYTNAGGMRNYQGTGYGGWGTGAGGGGLTALAGLAQAGYTPYAGWKGY